MSLLINLFVNEIIISLKGNPLKRVFFFTSFCYKKNIKKKEKGNYKLFNFNKMKSYII